MPKQHNWLPLKTNAICFRASITTDMNLFPPSLACVLYYSRVKQVLGSLRSQLPVLSDSEKDMKKELQTINDQLRHLGNGIKQVSYRLEVYHRHHHQASYWFTVITGLVSYLLPGKYEEGVPEETDGQRGVSSQGYCRPQRAPEEVCPGGYKRTVSMSSSSLGVMPACWLYDTH